MISVDHGSPTPPYDQIKQQVIGAVAAGDLRPGDKLPTVRALAATLGVAANTVARAYRELEADGLLRSRGRRGTAVAPAASPPRPSSAIAGEVDDVVRKARQLGLDGAAILALVTRSLARES